MNKKLAFKLFLLFLPLYIIMFYLNQQRTDKLIEHELDNKVKMVQVNVESSLHHFKTDAKNVNNFLSHNKEILEIIEKADQVTLEEQVLLRKELFVKTKHLYERIRNIGGYIFQFVLPNNTSFLRMHNPGKFGDNLSKIRESYSYVHENKKPIFAFENGELICAYRYIYPLFNSKQEYIGAFEISYSTQSLQESLLQINKLHNHFILSKEIFTKHNYTKEEISKRYIQSIEADNYLFGIDFKKTHNKLKSWEVSLIKPIKKEIEKNMALEKEFSLYREIDDEVVVMTFLPVKGIDEKTYGYIVAYDRSENIKNLLVNNLILNIIQFIALTGLFIFIFFLLKQKDLLEKEVKAKTSELKSLNENLQKIVVKEVEKNREKEKVLLKQQKIAALGEMMNAIAHQWKQPLGTILLDIQNFYLNYQLENKVEEKDIDGLEKNVTKRVNHLIETIDEFRVFFRPNQELTQIKLIEIVNSTLDLMKSELIKFKIETDIDISNNIELKCIPSEFKHVLINLINNSKDAFILNKTEDRNISIRSYQHEQEVVIEVVDNAGGIPEDIINEIFTSNFTTKEESGGTGIGLYLVKQILDKLLATIEVKNVENGVCFKITL